MKNRIRILATSDLHGMIYPHSYSDGSETMYGLARMKTLIDLLRDENTLVVDNGDTLQGSPLQSCHFQNHSDRVSPVTLAMNMMDYDYVNLGNHDFDYGSEALLSHLHALNAPCITNNVIYKGKPLCASYAVRETAGKKIALFGVTTHILKHLRFSKELKPFKLKDAFLSAQKTVDLIRRMEKPDYIIGLYHGGFERDLVTGTPNGELTGEDQAYQIMKEISGIDILITGHTHVIRSGTLFNKAYVQCGQYGDSLGCIDIYTDTGTIEPRIVPNDAPADASILETFQTDEAECQAWLDTVIGHTTMDLSIHDPFEARFYKSQVVTFINQIMMDATGADLAGTSLFRDAVGFHPEITIRDLASTYRYPDTLTVKKITGAQLRRYLEQSAEFWSVEGNRIIINPRFMKPKYKPNYYDMIDGIEYTIRVSEDPGSRIESLTRNGVPVQDDDIFTLCLCSYRANGGGGYPMMKDIPNVSHISTDMVQLLYDHFKANPVVSFEPVDNIHILR